MLFGNTVKKDTSSEISSMARVDLAQCFEGKEEGSGQQILIWQRLYLANTLK